MSILSEITTNDAFMSIITFLVSIISYFLKITANRINKTCENLVALQAKSDATFSEVSSNIKGIRKEISSIWSTLAVHKD